MPDDTDLREQVLEIADRTEITRLIHDFGYTVDLRDFHALAALFSDNGELRTPMGPPSVGPADVEADLSAQLPVLAVEERTYHAVSNIRIDLAGDGAVARSMWTYLVRSETDTPVISNVGHYDDDLVRERGRWRFRRRIVTSDIPLAHAGS